ncbi:MAG: universal stress protein [Thermoleophilia bacterium]|nr:universal stress protein [Thermoleophilia bacterium]
MDVVIVGVEETEEAKDALRFARLFADAEEAELHVVSVRSDTIFYEGTDQMEADREKFFEQMLEFAREEVGQDFHFHRAIEHSVPRGLTEAAEELEAGAMIIGSSHRGPIGRVLMGDAGARLAAGSPCSVIVTPRGWRRSGGARFGKIGIGFHSTRESEDALSYGSELAKKLKASVLIIGVVPAVISPGRGGFTDQAYWDHLQEDTEKAVAEATRRVGVDGAEGQVRVGYAADELTEASLDLDLLVLGSRSYGPIRRVLLGGTSVRVMRSSACPVVIVPRAGD